MWANESQCCGELMDGPVVQEIALSSVGLANVQADAAWCLRYRAQCGTQTVLLGGWLEGLERSQGHHKQLQLYIVHQVTLEENLALEGLQPGSVVLMHVYLKMHTHRIHLEMQSSQNYSSGHLIQTSCSLTDQSRAISHSIMGFTKVRLLFFFFSPQTSLKEGNGSISTRSCCQPAMSSSSKTWLVLGVLHNSLTDCLQRKNGMKETEKRVRGGIKRAQSSNKAGRRKCGQKTVHHLTLSTHGTSAGGK